MRRELNFEPFCLFPDQHQQTILGAFWGFDKGPKSQTKKVVLSDGDQLAYEVSTPSGWDCRKDPTVVLVHGLCGSHRSIYMARMAKRLHDNHIRSVRVNLRGCGSGKNLARKFYHAGQSDDLLAVLKVLKQEMPSSPILLIGYSLGGNLVLKLAGEQKSKLANYVRKIFAISPPLDLKDSVDRIDEQDNRIYRRYFMHLLKEDVENRKKNFPDLYYIPIDKEMKLSEFDERFMVPSLGFSDSFQFYQEGSAKNFLEKIKLPTAILCSLDDPIVSSASMDLIPAHDWIDFYFTHKGGHLGYLGKLKEKFYWLDATLIQWIKQDLQTS